LEEEQENSIGNLVLQLIFWDGFGSKIGGFSKDWPKINASVL
jgi:hypothetical protein